MNEIARIAAEVRETILNKNEIDCFLILLDKSNNSICVHFYDKLKDIEESENFEFIAIFGSKLGDFNTGGVNGKKIPSANDIANKIARTLYLERKRFFPEPSIYPEWLFNELDEFINNFSALLHHGKQIL